MSKKSKNQTVSKTVLRNSGQKQFLFGRDKLFDTFNQATPTVGFDASGLQGAIGSVQGFGASGATTGALDALGGFNGTSDAFRTLGALESFGAGEQGFVTDARNRVLNFDEGFESQSLPLLLEAAQGKFLTEQAGNPFIRDLIDASQRSTIENFNEQVLPGILSSFAGTGGVGSSLRAGVTAQQARDTQRNLGDIASSIGFNVFEAERQRQLAAQQSILGFEDAGLNRQLQARTTNLSAAEETARLLLAARQAAGSQATSLSGQRLSALQSAAQGRLGIDQLRLSALQSALSGQSSLAGLSLGASQANAALQNDRINQLLQFQQNASVAGTKQQQKVKKGLF